MLQALKCDFVKVSGVLGEHVTYSSTDLAAAVAAVAPELATVLSLATTSASALTTADCVQVAQGAAGPNPVFPPTRRRRALQSNSATVLATSPFATFTVMISIVAGDPVIGQVPVGTAVTPVITARLAAARAAGRASFPLTDTYWSAASAVSSWGTTTYLALAPGDPAVSGDTQGTLPVPVDPTLGLAIGLGVVFGVAFIVVVALQIFCGGAAGCRRRCTHSEPKPLDAEIAQDRTAADLQFDAASADGINSGFYAEERAYRA